MYSGRDVIADRGRASFRGEGRVTHGPIFVVHAWDDGTYVAAAHRDDDVRRPNRVISQRLGKSLVSEFGGFDLCEQLAYAGVHVSGWCGARGTGDHAAAATLTEERRSELRTARVCDAHEQHVRHSRLLGL